MSNIDKYKALGAKAAAEGTDMTKAKTGGGGDYEAPKEGFCLLRLVGYFELGKQPGTFQGKPTIKEKAMLTFEVSGPNHPPRVDDDGNKHPIRITIEENLSLNEKARFFKLFNSMNYAGKAQHMVQLLGEAFKGSIVHRKYAKKGEPKDDASKWTGIAVELFDKKRGIFTIEPPRYQPVDPATGMPTGEVKTMAVPPALTELKAFLWDYSDLADWSALFIEGEYPERKDEKTGKVIAPAKSKNVIQERIKQATNFKGSPIYNLIAAAGGNLDIPDSTQDEEEHDDTPVDQAAPPRQTIDDAPTGAAADDELNGVV